MTKKILSKAIVTLLAFLMVFSSLGVSVFAEQTTEDKEEVTKLQQIKEILNSITYSDYKLRYASAEKGKSNVVIDAEKYNKEKTTAKVIVVNNYEGKSGSALVIPEMGNVTWNFSMPTSGLYNIEIEYYPLDSYDVNGDGKIDDEVDIVSRSNTIERAILIDGVYPFKESRYIQFSRVWYDSVTDQGKLNDRGFKIDDDGSEIKPNKITSPEWRSEIVSDSTGYNVDNFLYYIEAGDSHTITLAEVQEPIVIKSIRIYYNDSVVNYEDYTKENQAKGYQPAKTDKVIEIQAEMSKNTSSQILYPIYDRSSAITMPQNASKIYLNTIGSEKWQTVGQWIRWEFNVEEDGLYKIAPRFKQSIYEGMYVSRELKIDGQTPFYEAKFLQFNYGSEWQLKPLNNGETEFEFYLTKGSHTIEMWVVLGEMADVIQKVEASLNRINDYYLKILMLTGPSPDEYRDYEFNRNMPDVLEGMLAESKILYDISANLESIIGSKGSSSITLDNVAFLLEQMGSNEDKIAANFDSLKTYIGSLGTWIMNTRNQPLELDYLLVYSADKEINGLRGEDGTKYKAEANMWDSIKYEFKQFIMSWINDYSSYGVRTVEGSENYKKIEVWTTSGRDQAQIMRSLISDKFTKAENIAVDLKLVAGGTLLPATLSGAGPDVMLTIGSGTVINYAIRSAALPVSPSGYVDEPGDDAKTLEYKAKAREIFSDFDEVISPDVFSESAIVPLTLYGVTYALPEQQSFSMLFYRLDILAELNIDVPETWDDIYKVLPILQTNNLQFGIQPSLTTLLRFMYQQNEPLYKPAVEGNEKTFGMQINLDSNVALDCFKKMCEMFTMYGFPMEFNFVNRFRTGEMPMGVATYTTYSQLTIFAPELRGLWEFTILPGTMQPDGTVNHATTSSVSGCMMVRGCDDMESSWKFMKWWVGADAQGEYGTEYKALLGASGQYDTANLEALFKMPWTASERKSLHEQFSYLVSTPEMPGGYIITRYVDFAFLSAYNNDANPVEALLNYIDTINAELSRKRSEFDLPTLEDYASK